MLSAGIKWDKITAERQHLYGEMVGLRWSNKTDFNYSFLDFALKKNIKLNNNNIMIYFEDKFKQQ